MANPVAFTTLDPHVPEAIEGATSAIDLDKLEHEIVKRMVVGQPGVQWGGAGPGFAPPILPGWTINVDSAAAPTDIAAAGLSTSYGRQLGRISSAMSALMHDTPPRMAAPSDVASIDDAMRHVQSAFVERLESAGLGREVVLALLELVNVTADAKVVQQQLVTKRVELANATAAAKTGSSVRVVASDPMEPLSASQLGERLGLHEQTVRTREREGKLFSILRAGRQRGQEFPAFQALPGVVGKPLEDTLTALAPAGQIRPVSGPEAYGFLTSPTDLLDDLSPVEVLLGRQLSSRALGAEAAAVLGYTPEVRLQLVVDTARAMAASDNA